MSLINWIFDAWQHSRISSLHQELDRMRLTARTRDPHDAQNLEQALGELALAVKTVQRLAVEKGLCTTAEFQSKLAEIDREDGAADGRAPL
jgi:hypothetical protein